MGENGAGEPAAKKSKAEPTVLEQAEMYKVLYPLRSDADPVSESWPVKSIENTIEWIF